MTDLSPRPIRWLGDSHKTLKALPREVRSVFGRALWMAQTERKLDSVKPLKGFGGASVLEVVADFDRNTFRAVYTVRFASFVYVLHVFQKKSKSGRATPKPDMNLIRTRLKAAERDYEEWRARNLKL
jgi:phage-related protein